jgi:hypothetical protein
VKSNLSRFIYFGLTPPKFRSGKLLRMVVARTMVDRALADELRAACMVVVLNLGGWDNKRKSKNGNSKRTRPRRVAAS